MRIWLRGEGGRCTDASHAPTRTANGLLYETSRVRVVWCQFDGLPRKIVNEATGQDIDIATHHAQTRAPFVDDGYIRCSCNQWVSTSGRHNNLESHLRHASTTSRFTGWWEASNGVTHAQLGALRCQCAEERRALAVTVKCKRPQEVRATVCRSCRLFVTESVGELRAALERDRTTIGDFPLALAVSETETAGQSRRELLAPGTYYGLYGQDGRLRVQAACPERDSAVCFVQVVARSERWRELTHHDRSDPAQRVGVGQYPAVMHGVVDLFVLLPSAVDVLDVPRLLTAGELLLSAGRSDHWLVARHADSAADSSSGDGDAVDSCFLLDSRSMTASFKVLCARALGGRVRVRRARQRRGPALRAAVADAGAKECRRRQTAARSARGDDAPSGERLTAWHPAVPSDDVDERNLQPSVLLVQWHRDPLITAASSAGSAHANSDDVRALQRAVANLQSSLAELASGGGVDCLLPTPIAASWRLRISTTSAPRSSRQSTLCALCWLQQRPWTAVEATVVVADLPSKRSELCWPSCTAPPSARHSSTNCSAMPIPTNCRRQSSRLTKLKPPGTTNKLRERAICARRTAHSRITKSTAIAPKLINFESKLLNLRNVVQH